MVVGSAEKLETTGAGGVVASALGCSTCCGGGGGGGTGVFFLQPAAKIARESASAISVRLRFRNMNFAS
jgi:hypothetical protein